MSVPRRALLLVALSMAPHVLRAFEVESVDTTRVSLDSHTQQPARTLVFLWTLECPAREAQKPDINDFANEYRNKGGHAVGLAPTFLLYRPGGELLGVHSGPIGLDQVRHLIGTGSD